MYKTILPAIGTIQPENPFFLAPMEAVNCASFRLLCKRRGASVVFTDMIDVDDFVQRKDPVKELINPQPDEQPLIVQLGGSKLDQFVETIAKVERFAAGIDINIGCPLPHILGRKGGVYLMKHPDQLYNLIAGIRASTTLPLTVKLRSGWDKNTVNVVEVSKELEKLGVDAITVHARTRVQQYRDRADWQLVREVKEQIKIPVILSGDVTNAYMAYMAFAHTKCDYIMCARSAKANPSVFRELMEYWNKGEQPIKPQGMYVKDTANTRNDFLEFLELYKEREHRYKFSELQDHALWTSTGCRGNYVIKQRILAAKNEETLKSVFKRLEY